MKDSTTIVKGIRRAAAIGLYGTLLVSLAVVAEHFLALQVWQRTIVTNDYTHRLLVVLGIAAAVVDISLVLSTLRRQIPRLRQLDDVDDRLNGYRSLVRSVFYGSLCVAVIVSACVVISGESAMIMLLLLLFVTLMMSYPNMYKMKVDLGMNDNDMKGLFGDSYIADNVDQDSDRDHEKG